MLYDSLTMAAVCTELKNDLESARLERIYQPARLEVHLHLRAKNGPLLLVCSADARFGRVHLSEEKQGYPASPPPFCMLLRKHLEGARLLEISQQDLDRVLVFTFRSQNEAGMPARKHLICEIMGKHSNLILAEEAPSGHRQILGSVKTVTWEMSRYRAVAPGETYLTPPHRQKLSLTAVSEEALALALNAQTGHKPEQLLVETVSGLSPEISRELLFRAAGDLHTHPLEVVRPLTIELHRLATMLKRGSFEPCIVVSPDGAPRAFAPLGLTRYPPEWLHSFTRMNDALDSYYRLVLRRHREDSLRQQLKQAVDAACNRAAKKTNLRQRELEEAEDADRYRLYGELLTAGLHNIKPGTATAQVTNYYSDNQETVSIPLDPTLSPQENIRRYFKKYRKLKEGCLQLAKRLRETEEETHYLSSLQLAISHADLETLGEIRLEMEQSGLIRQSHRPAREPEPSSRPLHFTSPDGISIWVGRNNRQNDLLTLKKAAPEDTWLHARDIPGAHVIIKDSNPPAGTLLMAARLAALYSKAGSSDKVPVDYTLVRHVRKPKGARPGMVVYTHQRTIYVSPGKAEK